MSTMNQKLLRENIDAFCECTGVPVTLYSPSGEITAEFLAEQKFCKFFDIYGKVGGECGKNLAFSAKISYDMGEPYIYTCPIGLIHIAVPILADEKYCACAIAGPLSMGPVDDKLLEQALVLNSSSYSGLSKIALFISGMKVYTPNQIQKLSTLFYSAVLNIHKNWTDYEQLRARHRQQLMVGEHIQKRKVRGYPQPEPGNSSPTCAQLEVQLGKALRERDREGALTCLDNLFEELILVEGGSFDSIKLHIFELYISLSRLASEGGASLRNIFGSDFKLINSLNGLDTVSQLAIWTREMALHFIVNVFSALPQLSGTTTQAVTYINAHYMEKLTLRDLAAALFVNDSYLSKLFRQDLKTSFTDYLNNIRIEHSVELMRSTSLSLLEIAGMVGFDDQSYFTKIFKKITGTTPRQYKAELSKNSERQGN